jgi:toxin ParE1/3/4
VLTLSLTPKAESDLVEIWVYTCDEWGLDQAGTYLDQLEEGMKQLIHHPSLGTDYARVKFL